jgi:hypothetical protein
MYSNSCFNTVNDSLNSPQIAVNAGLGPAPFRAFPHDVMMDGLDVAKTPVNSRQIIHVLLAQTTACSRSRCHIRILTPPSLKATAHFCSGVPESPFCLAPALWRFSITSRREL